MLAVTNIRLTEQTELVNSGPDAAIFAKRVFYR